MTRQCVICGEKASHALRKYPLFDDGGDAKVHVDICSIYMRAGECLRELQELWAIHLGLQEERT